MFGGWAIRETGAMKRPEEPLAGAIPGEDATGPVAAVSSGRQAQDEEASVGLAERWHWPTPILLIAKGCSFLACDPLAPLHEARAQPAELDFRIQGTSGFCFERRLADLALGVP